MIANKELLAKLKDFGLNSYEVKLWVALLSRGVSTAGELSDIANVPRSRTYDVLESLEKKGFIIMKIGKPIKYLAIEPERVIDVIKKHIHDDANQRSKMIENVKTSDVLKELQLLHTQGIEHIDPTDLSGSVRGRQNLYSHMEATIANAEESVIIVTTDFESKMSVLLPILQKVAKRGVTIRIAAPDAKNLPELSFAQVKKTDVRSRFIVVDGKEVIFMVMDATDIHPTYDVGIWVNTPFFATALEQLFELAWAEMITVK